MEEGKRMYDRAGRIFPLCRSITGEGVRETLRILNQEIWGGDALQIHEIPTGAQVFDWTIPKEWCIKSAYIEDGDGNRIIDMADNNLHVMGYSMPVDSYLALDELKTHIYVQDGQPDAIPYVTSYYQERYGMCMSQKQLDALKPGTYHMVVDSMLFDGSLTYADMLLEGGTEEEILITSYICHPSMANNECSGPSLLVELVNYVKRLEKRTYSYRFVLNPETIGSIAYLSRHLQHLKKYVKAGVVLSCVGDDRAYSLVHSRNANTFTDRTLHHILRGKPNYKEYPYLQRSSDERQYNAPGVDLPVVCFGRSKLGEFPEYHTSDDNMNLVSPQGFQGAFDAMVEWIDAIEYNRRYHATVLCEPQLGKRGLYPMISQKGSYGGIKAMSNFLAYADGRRDLFEISEIAGVPVKQLLPVADTLLKNGLVEVVG